MSLYSNFKQFPKTIGEIPTSYRESISYEEQILWLCNFLEKEVLPQVEISQSIVDEIESAFDNLKKEIEKQLDDFDSRINDVKVYSDAQNEILKTIIEQQIRQLNLRFDNIPQTLIVYNPTNGMQEPLDKTLNDIYSGARVGALTATEYDSLELTATTYDGYELTASEYDMNGKEELAS